MSQQFKQWLRAQGLDANQWETELLDSLKRRYELEQRPTATIEAKQPTRIVLDARGCDWPARVYRVTKV